MLFCTEKHYPRITLDALSSFREDKQAARRFAHRFLPLSFACVVALVCFGLFIFIPIHQEWGETVPRIYVVLAMASFAVCGVVFILTWRRMVRAVPISPQSKQPMEVYRLEDTIKFRKYELVYLCRQSHTFFRMVFKAPAH